MTVITDSVQTGRVYNQSGTREFAQCTAWVNFDGAAATVAIRDSLNVSSITDNGTGDYTVNFAQSMDNTDYLTVGTASFLGASTTASLYPVDPSTLLLSSVGMRLQGSNGTYYDRELCNVAIFGGITL